MRVVEDHVFGRSRGSRGKYTALYEEFAAAPRGTKMLFERGADFDGPAKTFAMTLRSGMAGRGLRTEIEVRGDEVYARVVGRTAKKRAVAAGDGDSPVPRGDGDAAAAGGDGDAPVAGRTVKRRRAAAPAGDGDTASGGDGDSPVAGGGRRVVAPGGAVFRAPVAGR